MIAGKIGAAASPLPSFRVGDERLIKLTENAGRKVSGLLTKQGRPQGVLRVSVVGGGCSGLSYKLEFDNQLKEGDQQFEDKGIKIVVDKKSFL